MGSPFFALFVRALPWVIFVWFPVEFLTCYLIAVTGNNVNPFFAYVSDVGTLPPEMCWFALAQSQGQILVSLFVYIRFKQIEQLIPSGDSRTRARTANRIALVIGLTAGLGLTVAGCCQETNVPLGHLVGALMIFFGAGIYFMLQGWLTKLLIADQFGTRLMAWFRLVGGLLCALSYILLVSTSYIAYSQFKYKDDPDGFIKSLKWKREHGGWTLRITSVVAEWTMGGLMQLLFVSFVPEFRKTQWVSQEFRVEPFKVEGNKVNPGSGGKGVHSPDSAGIQHSPK